MRTCSSCGSANAEGARFCSTCGSPLQDATATGERRQLVSVVFCDLVGSTPLGEQLDPESLRRVMLRYYAEMRFALERHGGTVEKFIGDAVMALFGVPSMHEDDALRAVRAALDMKEALDRLNEELGQRWGVRLHTRTGVNTGKVVVGDPSPGEGFAVGDAINVAARLEQAAPRDEILIGADTYSLVQNAVEVAPVEPLTLKGKSEPVPAFRLLAASRERPTRRLESPIVGREAELSELGRAFELAETNRQCRLFTVFGTPGVGKSRLASEFVSSLRGRATILRGRCLSYGDGITFWPVAEMVRQAAGIEDGDGADSAREALGRLLEDPEDGLVQPLLGVLGLAPARTSEETFLALRVFFARLARRLPLAIVFDDIHWAEQTLLDLIEYLVDTGRETSQLVLCLTRPELRELRPSLAASADRRGCTTLTPLGGDQSRRLVENLIGQNELAADLARQIEDSAQGNPLFVEEMLRMLVDEGWLRRETGGWAIEGNVAEIGVPPTIETLLAARLDRLDQEERSVIERASVIGKEFWPSAIADLSPENDRGASAERLAALVEKELIEPGGPSFAGEAGLRFSHILIRDVTYGGLLKEARAVLHERFADWLEQRTGGQVSDYEEIVGYHLEQSFRYREDLGPLDDEARAVAARAFSYLSSAGAHAHSRGDIPAAIKLIQHSIALLEEGDPAALELMLRLGQALFHTGDFERSKKVLATTEHEANRAGDVGLALHAELERADIESFDEPETGLDHLADAAKRGIPIFEALGDEAGLARSWRALSICESDRSRWGAAVEALERALIHAERAKDHELHLQIASGLGFALFLGPVPVDEALARMPALTAIGGKGDQALVNGVGGAGLTAMGGRLGEAREIIRRSKEILGELGQLRRVVQVEIGSGRIEALAGDLEAAEREYRSAYDSLAAMGDVSVLPTVAAELAELAYAWGDYREAERLALESERDTASNDLESQIRWRAVRAKTLARQARLDEAKGLARAAVRMIANVQFPLLESVALLSLAEVERLSGSLVEAALAIERACDVHKAKGNVLSVRAMQALLDDLRAPAP
jgi:class 3 adenylate cyclase/tetratricopeptide (TPR) repeat protein